MWDLKRFFMLSLAQALRIEKLSICRKEWRGTITHSPKPLFEKFCFVWLPPKSMLLPAHSFWSRTYPSFMKLSTEERCLFSSQLEEGNAQVITNIFINRTVTLATSFDLCAKGEINVICSPQWLIENKLLQNTLESSGVRSHFHFTFG